MFGWFKHTPKCKHYKKFGDKPLSNMKRIIRFSPYVTDDIGFTISECTGCGIRAFGAVYYHLMGAELTDKIDAFIRYEINIDELVSCLQDNHCWFELGED